MAEYLIQARLDPSGVTAGKSKVVQDLQQVKGAAAETGSAMAQAFASPQFEGAVNRLVNEIRALRGEVTQLGQTTSNIAASNARAANTLDSMARAATSASGATGALGSTANSASVSQAKLDAATRKVLTAVDQEALELEKLNQLMAAANLLKSQGAIDSEHYAAVQQLVTNAMNAENVAGARQVVSLGQRRAAYQNLGYQVQDISMGLAMGINPLTVFAQQAGQTASAVQLMTGETSGFIGFMAGPWGAVTVAAIALLGNLALAYYGSGEAAHAAEVGANALASAQSVLGGMFDLTSGKIEHQNGLLLVNARLTAITLRGDAQTRRQSADQTFQRAYESRGGMLGDINASLRGVGDIHAAQSAVLRPYIERIRATRPGTPERAAALDAAMRFAGVRGNTASTDVIGNLTNVSGNAFRQAIIDVATADQNEQVASAIDRSLDSHTLDPSLRRDARGGRRRGARERRDPVAEFFTRLEEQRDAAGLEPSLDRRILEEQQKARREFHREPTGPENERIAGLVREIDAREMLQHLVETYNAPLQRELTLLGQTGLQRQVNNAIMTEEATRHRTLTADQRILIENSIRWRDSLARQQQAIEEQEGGVENYRLQVEALTIALQHGAISQDEFDHSLRNTPLAQQQRQFEQTLGGMTAYQSRLEQINAEITDQIALIDRLERAGIYDPETARRRRIQTQGFDRADGDSIQVGGPSSLRSRMQADLARQQRQDLSGVNQALGGNFAFEAQRDQIVEENRQRLQILKDAREQELLTEEEYNRRVVASRDKMNQDIMALDRARYQTALHAASESFGQLADAIKGFAGEHSKAYRAMFIVSKAFAIAESIIAIQVAIAQAMKLPFPANIPAIASAITLGAGILANITAVTAQFKGGGYTGDGSPDDVAGFVHRKEFVMPADVVARPGNRALLEAMRSGAMARQTAAAGESVARAGGSPNVTIHNYAGADIEVQQGLTENDVVIIARRVTRTEAPRAVADDMANPNSRTSKAVARGFTTQRKRL